ncbi:MAG: TRAP transporter substrate-binding protein [bacterium]
MQNFKRREFLKKGAVATLAGGAALAGCGQQQSSEGPAIRTRKNYQWQMVTTWPPGFPVMGEGAEMMAKWIEDMSEGQLKIKVFGANELVPAFESFEAVSQGIAQMSHGVAYYWAGKSEAAPFFGAVPFGMNTQQMNAWICCGGGLELWEELYAPFNITPMPAGNTGMQMGGWFNKEINSIADLKGLKMRIPGLGGKVIDKAGGTGLSTPGSEIYTNLDRGVIDATEWVGPYHDFKLGLHKIAEYYYYPGWHEPCAVLELGVNKAAFEGLPKNLQEIIRTAAARANIWMLSEFEAKNNEYLLKLIDEHNVKLRRFPDDVLDAFRKYAQEIIDDLVARDAMGRKIYDSYMKFRRAVSSWAEVSEQVYYAKMNKV